MGGGKRGIKGVNSRRPTVFSVDKSLIGTYYVSSSFKIGMKRSVYIKLKVWIKATPL